MCRREGCITVSLDIGSLTALVIAPKTFVKNVLSVLQTMWPGVLKPPRMHTHHQNGLFNIYEWISLN